MALDPCELCSFTQGTLMIQPDNLRKTSLLTQKIFFSYSYGISNPFPLGNRELGKDGFGLGRH